MSSLSLQVKCVAVLQKESYKTKNGDEHVKCSFVGETLDRYVKKVKFDVLSEEKFNNMNLAVGNTYDVSFNVSSREWQGKWFTTCEAWRVSAIGSDTGTNTSPQSNGGDEKPF